MELTSRTRTGKLQRARLYVMVMIVIGVIANGTSAAARQSVVAESENATLVANLRTGAAGDIAFWGDLAAVSTGLEDKKSANDGFVLVDISDPMAPRQISEFRCPNAAFDISIWGDLVVLSAQPPASANECRPHSPRLATRPTAAEILVVDISKPQSPALIAAVATQCGTSHTHTLLPDLDNARLIVYNSGPGGGCVAPITIPLRQPSRAQAHPEIFTGLDEGPIATVIGGNDGSAVCHDITVFVDEELAACAATSLGVTQLWDISNPLEPAVLSQIDNRVLEQHHSTAFSSDGDTLIIGEEKFSTLVTEQCTGGTATPLGALWFYDISDPANPQQLSYYQLPRPGADGYCSAHYFSVVPLRDGRDVLTSAWYRGGTTVVDFTDPKQPEEIAYFDASPLDRGEGSHAYSSYWYNGFVYVTNFGGSLFSPETFGSKRGLDVLQIDEPLLSSAAHLPYLNAQTQMWHAPMNDREAPSAGGIRNQRL